MWPDCGPHDVVWKPQLFPQVHLWTQHVITLLVYKCKTLHLDAKMTCLCSFRDKAYAMLHLDENVQSYRSLEGHLMVGVFYVILFVNASTTIQWTHNPLRQSMMPPCSKSVASNAADASNIYVCVRGTASTLLNSCYMTMQQGKTLYLDKSALKGG